MLLAAALAAGLLLHRALRRSAESAEAPYAGTVRYYGKGGGVAIARALEETGSPPAEAASVAGAVSRRLGRGAPGSFVVAASTGGAFQYVAASRGRRRVVVGRGSRGVRTAEVAERLMRVQGVVKGPLPASLERAGVPPGLAQDFLDVFRWSLDLTSDAKDGDRFAAAWTERSSGGETIGRKLEGAAYRDTAGVLFDGEFLDAKSRPLRRAYLRAPMRYHSISSDYGGLRFGFGIRRHHGTDFAAPMGTPVLAVADGVVLARGWLGEYGYRIVVRHPDGRETLYGHLSRYGLGIRPGGAVRQGRVLGYVGRSGNATGPHLHFELRKDGRTLDFRSAELPGAPKRVTTRPLRFRERWQEVFKD